MMVMMYVFGDVPCEIHQLQYGYHNFAASELYKASRFEFKLQLHSLWHQCLKREVELIASIVPIVGI